MAQKIRKRFGNFVLTHDEKSGFVAVKAASGFWQVRFRNDHPMFGVLLRYCDDNEMGKYFEHLFGLWYIITQGLADLPCMTEITDACGKWLERLGNIDKLSPVSKEEDDEILNETVVGDEMRDKLLEEDGKSN